ncbi:helix-turn-helix domain-containing protein [Xenorhabdus bovienii]|uniref:Cro (Modular protein) n=1 Tax=Xenorhabdus bovienii (strain SS-2004) TaxID=406818 RepID=D3UXK6_XENBS|nr:YdaS family helix-turn-helix protein [Xenorhabdus bovienii]MDE1475994.1 helix-turn-helix domain-containing protein [Xenorhabdus bovienii]MDE9435664.1 helix-turn-helix domain-containing protein [Xenorhabdus bovienii]MDE9492667.1 helix-turn-helix domain-containing protein [Xenorhabdus bovienii]MDE9497612.1 helix-turn-helix domain-containing protein [Xenorhabdus bovienii]MDE9501194.1 helix-turn-helix domain-containing protein [Xenorhabdus bovienii]
MKNSVIKKVIDIAGSQAKLAQVLGCAQSLISAWLYGKKRVSVSLVPDIVVLSNGAVQAHELRPDLPTVFPPPEAKAHESIPVGG